MKAKRTEEPVIDHRTAPFIRRLAYAGFLCVGCLSMQGVALGQSFCSEPIAPYCADKDSEFDTVLQINRCEEDLTEYESQLSEYEQCVKSQIDGLRQELRDARKKLEEAKKNF